MPHQAISKTRLITIWIPQRSGYAHRHTRFSFHRHE